MRLPKVCRDELGGAAVEYALVLPAFITLIVGALCLGQVAFAVNSLHYAVQDASRCAAVKTTVCTDSNATVTYARSKYAGCGHTVTGTGSYPLILFASTINVPLSASACYP
jgi:Flp pilus assembly protein TadG